MTTELLSIRVPPGVEGESQSGLQLSNPRVYGALARGHRNRVCAVVMHPNSNFLGHYLLDPLAEAGVDTIGLNSRYVNNDSTLIMERVIQDLGAAVAELRDRGYEKVFLIGNSGGGGLMAFYQAQAEHLTISHTPAGDPVSLVPEQLPPADGVAFVAAHLGRPQLLAGLVDPSVIDENDAMAADPALDMYDRRNGPPFDPDFVARYRAAQLERMVRITDRVRRRLDFLRSNDIAADEAFVVYRTYADPRYIDPSLDPNDRVPVSDHRGADPRKTNYGANTLGRFCTLTSWLSQWSPDSHALGPSDLTRTSVPLLQVEYTADASVFPSAVKAWADAGGDRMDTVPIVGATHYASTNDPELLVRITKTLADWMLSQ